MSEPVDNGEPAQWAYEPAPEAVDEPLSVLPTETEAPQVLPVEHIDPMVAWLKGGHPFIAWILIGLFVLVVPFLREQRAGGEPAAQASHLSLLVFTMQAKLLVGFNDFLHSANQTNDTSMVQEAEKLNVGSLDQRLCYIVLVGELGGFHLAQEKLAELDRKISASPNNSHSEQALRAKETLERLYADYQAGLFGGPAVGEADRQNLKQTLGWLGELALAPRGGGDDSARQKLLASADNIFIVIIPLFGLGCLLGLAGSVGLIFLCAYIFNRVKGSGVVAHSGSGGIYAETFALWMFAFLVLSFAPLVIRIPGAELLVTAFATLSSLFVLVWPVLRGIPWRQVRQDIGLHGGGNLLVEPLLGPVGYAISLPLLCIGAILMLVLMRLQGGIFPGASAALFPLADEFNPVGFPTHPIVEILARPGWNGKLQVLFLGTVIAPIIEEIMFRGVLYRHMRDATGRWSLFASVVVSALVVSFVFAVIHPQGLVAVPALMGLAMGFTLMRQWRGSLISCMCAHGINNGIVMLLAAFIFGA